MGLAKRGKGGSLGTGRGRRRGVRQKGGKEEGGECSGEGKEGGGEREGNVT